MRALSIVVLRIAAMPHFQSLSDHDLVHVIMCLWYMHFSACDVSPVTICSSALCVVVYRSSSSAAMPGFHVIAHMFARYAYLPLAAGGKVLYGPPFMKNLLRQRGIA